MPSLRPSPAGVTSVYYTGGVWSARVGVTLEPCAERAGGVATYRDGVKTYQFQTVAAYALFLELADLAESIRGAAWAT
jgi:hypothetical protein